MAAQNTSQAAGNDLIESFITLYGQRTSEQNELLQMIAASLQGIEMYVRQIAVSSDPAPNYRRSLDEYPKFDWASIGATVLKNDSDGVAVVEWNGQQFTRRSANNRFDAAIWYSRTVGKDSEGNTRYVRLITFKAPAEAEPIAVKAKRAIDA